MSRYAPRRIRRGGLPRWLVFLVAVALVFGTFYLWDGVQRFVRTGGLGVAESTVQAVSRASATAERVTRGAVIRTLPPSATPLPECQSFRVRVVNAPTAIVRAAASTTGAILDAYEDGTEICVLYREPNSEFYAIDTTPSTRRLEIGYMHESVVEALYPTLTPSATITMPPSVTPLPSTTPLATAESAQPTLPPVPTRPEATASGG